jgi:hypothetical protein
MNLRVNVQTDGLTDMIEKLSARGVAYATTNAINNVAKLIQKTERENLDERFTVRTPKTRAFLERQIAKIKPFANVKQGRPSAEISVGQAPRLLLSLFETGGKKVPARGKRVAVPITGGPARVAFESPVAERFYLRKLKFKARKTRSGKVQYKGVQRTFLLKSTTKNPAGGVYQRVGKYREDVRLVYSFKQRPRLRAVLKFVQTADEVAKRWLQQEFKQQLQLEIARANRRAGA